MYHNMLENTIEVLIPDQLENKIDPDDNRVLNEDQFRK